MHLRKPPRTKTEIDKWIKANIKDKARLTKLEDTANEIDSTISTLKADKLDLPNLCRLTIAWGWDPKLAQSASQNALIRMLATANARRLMVSPTLPCGLC